MKFTTSALALALVAACALTPLAACAPQRERPLAAAKTARETNPNFPTPWWAVEISKKPDAWYRSDDGKRIAANILSWQDKTTGGWSLMNTTREPFTCDVSRAGPWGMHGALIKASVNDIRFLARAYRATKEAADRDAALAGIDFILKAQYPSGGWPHSYPVRMSDYTHYATFNDDEMPDLMALLQEVAASPDFTFVDTAKRAAAQGAFDRGVDFIVKSQIRVNGKLTAWPQQAGEMTYEPRPARAFEPAAISGGESASVLEWLMSNPKPSPRIIAAVEAGVQWYHAAQIDGLRLTQTADDRVATPDPSAPPIWARYCEIGTGKPIFAGRDGIVRYALADIEKERRGGYAWYNYSGARVFALYAK